jgi:hypothetical protein
MSKARSPARPRQIANSRALQVFVGEVRELEELASQVEVLAPKRLLLGLAQSVTRLLNAWYELCSFELPRIRTENLLLPLPRKKFDVQAHFDLMRRVDDRLLCFSRYWIPSDVYSDPEVVMASIGDDLGDLIRDLSRGLTACESGSERRCRQAVRTWRLHFYHWGEHATRMLLAINFALFRYFNRKNYFHEHAL